MPKNRRILCRTAKKEGILLSVIMSLIMIYVMAALNECVKNGAFAADAWVVSLQRLPLGFVVGIIGQPLWRDSDRREHHCHEF